MPPRVPENRPARFLLAAAALALVASACARNDDPASVARAVERLLAACETATERVARSADPQGPPALVFDALLDIDRPEGASLGVYDADGRPLAWAGVPVDLRSVPSADPARSAWAVLATPFRSALVVTTPLRGGAFALASVPLREAARSSRGALSMRDRFTVPGGRLEWLDRGDPAGSGDAPGDTVVVRGVPVARVRHGGTSPPAGPDDAAPAPWEALAVAVVGLIALRAGFSAARGGAPGGLAGVAAPAVAIVLAGAAVAFWVPALRLVASGDSAPAAPGTPAPDPARTLELAEREMDATRLFHRRPPGGFGASELAFDLWMSSALSEPGLASFVEIMDRSGVVTSRYARGLQASPASSLPPSASWTRVEERLRTRDNRPVTGLTSDKLLLTGAELEGGIRIGVAPGAPAATARPDDKIDRSAALDTFFAGTTVGLAAYLLGAVWAFPGGPRQALRTLRRLYAFRLFLGFFALAAVTLLIFQTAIRGFVEERLVRDTESEALRLADIAQRSLSDLSAFQEAELPGAAAVSDAAVAWVAGLVANEIELFDESGALLATSEREEVDAGLVPRVAPAAAYRALIHGDATNLLESPPGSLAPVSVSTRLALPAGRRGLVRMNLQSREAQVRDVMQDLDRRMRLATLSLLIVATVLAFLLASRISNPILDLTSASRRIARGDFEARVSAATGDEVEELAGAFNSMAGDLARQRREIERRERLAAWADMASQVAHEVKNPLTPIQLSTEHLMRAWRQEEQRAARGDGPFGAVLDTCVRTILEQVRRLRDISSEFAAFVREPSPVREPVDLRRVTSAALEPYRDVLPEAVRLDGVPEGPPALVSGDARLLERAVVNLVQNAIQAVGSSGRVAADVRVEDGRVIVRVDDDGPGFDESARDRLFEPFFSTKAFGSGLGLALVRKVAQDHGGDATLERLPEGVTRAELRLPRGSGSV